MAARVADVEGWLLAGDPSIRWQVLRDLRGGTEAEVLQERARVATTGWGADLLGRQDPDGLWAGALYSPKWTSTTYTLLQLHRLGVLPQERTRRGSERLWQEAKVHGGGLNLARTVREPEVCITGMLVLLGTVFGGVDRTRLDQTVAWLLAQQLGDGGWNCDTVRTGSQHGSFHTTISVLEALGVFQDQPGHALAPAVAPALADGAEFLLRHHLFRSRRTGEVVDPAYLRFPFPPQWHYDVLRGLEHVRAVAAAHDPRLEDAVQVLREARRPDGTWSRHRPWPGRSWFVMEGPGPSRWATLRCLRVLRWWDATDVCEITGVGPYP